MRYFLFLLIGFSLNTFAENKEFYEKANTLLEANVTKGFVNYQGLKSNSKELGALMKTIASYEWTKEEEKAYLINVYNLGVINKIVQNYPVRSPMDIANFFEKKDLNLNGKKVSLNEIENKMLRPTYKDPRFHFSLVCGALGCPKLRSEAYTPVKLEEQLEEQTNTALNNNQFIYQDSRQGIIYLSEIFVWYKEDFGGKNDSVISYINTYRQQKLDPSYKVTTYSYNWSSNDIIQPKDDGTQNQNQDENKDAPNDEFNIQTFTAGSLLGKNKFDFTLFNTLYTENKNNWQGQDFTGYRAAFLTHLFQVSYGISENKRINVGLDFNLRNNGRSVDSTFGGLKPAFQYSNTDSTRFGLTSIGARVKVQPFKGVNNFSIQSTFYIPTIKAAEGDASQGLGMWADWDRFTWWNQFFFDKTWDKWQLFFETDLLFRFKKAPHQIGMLDIPMTFIASYFPIKSLTIYAITQHVPRLTNPIAPQNPQITDWVIPMNYTTAGLGMKYNISNNLNLEVLYTNFVRGTNSGLGQTFNIGLKYIML